MKRSLIYIALFLVTFSVISSCDKKDQPIADFDIQYRSDLYGEPPSFGPATTSTRNVFFEEFTGHKCGVCPSAGLVLEELLHNNPGRVSAIAIHAGGLAEPMDSEPFTTDWTSDDGDVLWDQLDFQSNPSARINRKGGLGVFNGPSLWESETLSMINQAAVVNLQLIANYESQGNHMNVHLNGQFAQAFSEPTNVTIYITESDLVGGQLWYGNDPETVNDYTFNHVLRGSVSGPMGLTFTSEAVQSNSTKQVNYSYEWNNEWVVENCSVIAIVTDATSGEVLNVVEAHL